MVQNPLAILPIADFGRLGKCVVWPPMADCGRWELLESPGRRALAAKVAAMFAFAAKFELTALTSRRSSSSKVDLGRFSGALLFILSRAGSSSGRTASCSAENIEEAGQNSRCEL